MRTRTFRPVTAVLSWCRERDRVARIARDVAFLQGARKSRARIARDVSRKRPHHALHGNRGVAVAPWQHKGVAMH